MAQNAAARPSLGIALVGAMAKVNESRPLGWKRLFVFAGPEREEREREGGRGRERAKDKPWWPLAAPAHQEGWMATHGQAKSESGQVSNFTSGDSAAGSA